MAQAKVKDIKPSKASGLEIIYTLFLALTIALFFGLSVQAFYTQPTEPIYPTTLQINSKDSTMSNEQIAAQTEYDKSMKLFQKEFSIYNRNVSIITLALAIISLTIGLIFFSHIFVLSNGLLLGGLFTLVYSAIRGLMTDDAMFRLIAICASLLIVLVIGYFKFIKPKNLEQ